MLRECRLQRHNEGLAHLDETICCGFWRVLPLGKSWTREITIDDRTTKKSYDPRHDRPKPTISSARAM